MVHRLAAQNDVPPLVGQGSSAVPNRQVGSRKGEMLASVGLRERQGKVGCPRIASQTLPSVGTVADKNGGFGG